MAKAEKVQRAVFIPLLKSIGEPVEEKKLKKYTPCIFEDSSKIVEAIAEVHTELVLIHPFL